MSAHSEQPSDTKAELTGYGSGKIILLGEHAVVYGSHALAASIERGVAIRGYRATSLSLEVPAWDLTIRENDGPPDVRRAMLAMAQHTDISQAALVAESDLWPGSGLGSSAALCMALARALSPNASPEQHLELASLGEEAFHDSPSGVDVALAAGAGLSRFSREEGLRPIEGKALEVVVAHSGVERKTHAMVVGLRERLNTEPACREHIDTLSRLVDEGCSAIGRGDVESLGACMNRAQEALRSLSLSHPALDSIVEVARNEGALGAKLSGAGGGGVAIALCPERSNAVCRALENSGFACFATHLGQSRS